MSYSASLSVSKSMFASFKIKTYSRNQMNLFVADPPDSFSLAAVFV